MPDGQRHLTHPGRCRIHVTGKSGLSDAAIARQPGRDRTTVARGAPEPGKARFSAGRAAWSGGHCVESWPRMRTFPPRYMGKPATFGLTETTGAVTKPKSMSPVTAISRG